MHDHRDGGDGHGGSPRHGGHRHDHDGECREGDDGPDRHRGGPDTRFLQLEMSQVLYGEAEGVTRQAFRDLLLEAAKERWREHYGDKIIALANLAVDELMKDVRSSLDIEARIQEHNQDGGANERARAMFAEGGSQKKNRGERAGGSAPRRGRR